MKLLAALRPRLGRVARRAARSSSDSGDGRGSRARRRSTCSRLGADWRASRSASGAGPAAERHRAADRLGRHPRAEEEPDGAPRRVRGPAGARDSRWSSTWSAALTRISGGRSPSGWGEIGARMAGPRAPRAGLDDAALASARALRPGHRLRRRSPRAAGCRCLSRSGWACPASAATSPPLPRTRPAGAARWSPATTWTGWKAGLRRVLTDDAFHRAPGRRGRARPLPTWAEAAAYPRIPGLARAPPGAGPKASSPRTPSRPRSSRAARPCASPRRPCGSGPCPRGPPGDVAMTVNIPFSSRAFQKG